MEEMQKYISSIPIYAPQHVNTIKLKIEKYMFKNNHNLCYIESFIPIIAIAYGVNPQLRKFLQTGTNIIMKQLNKTINAYAHFRSLNYLERHKNKLGKLIVKNIYPNCNTIPRNWNSPFSNIQRVLENTTTWKHIAVFQVHAI